MNLETISKRTGTVSGSNQAQGIQAHACQEGGNSKVKQRSEEPRYTDRDRQGNSARNSTGDKPMCETLFSEWSYGFRSKKSYEMAIRQLLVYLNEGYEWIVDNDLEKLFDNVPQDRLMSLVRNVVDDGDSEYLIRNT